MCAMAECWKYEQQRWRYTLPSPELNKDQQRRMRKWKAMVDVYLKVIVITVPFVAGWLNSEEVPEVNSDKVAIVGAYCPAISSSHCFLSSHTYQPYFKVGCLTILDFIPSPEALNPCWIVERVAWWEEYVVLSVSHGEVPAKLLLQPRVHALLSRGGGVKVEGDGEEEEEVGQVDGHHHYQQELPLRPHFHQEHPLLQRSSLLTIHTSLRWFFTRVAAWTFGRCWKCVSAFVCSVAAGSGQLLLHDSQVVTKAGGLTWPVSLLRLRPASEEKPP